MFWRSRATRSVHNLSIFFSCEVFLTIPLLVSLFLLYYAIAISSFSSLLVIHLCHVSFILYFFTLTMLHFNDIFLILFPFLRIPFLSSQSTNSLLLAPHFLRSFSPHCTSLFPQTIFLEQTIFLHHSNLLLLRLISLRLPAIMVPALIFT